MRALRRSKRGPSIDTEATPIPAPITKARTFWPRIRRIFLWVILFLALTTLGVGLGAYYGFHQGDLEREQSRLDEAVRHYQEGLAQLDAGEYERAIAEFEYVLKINPSHPTAQQGIAEAQARIAARPTPTSEVYEIVVDDLYQDALARYEAEEWEEAIAVLTQLRVLDPAHEAETVVEMLFTSLYNAGMALLDEDRFEEGIFYLDQAVALRPLDEETLAQRSLAIQYMTALGYWGVDWDYCIDRFGQIYAIAPNYKDVFRRLYDAHVTYADAWYAQEEMCPAEEQYTQALQLMNDPSIEQRQADAAQICAVATPTPIAPIEGTQTITLTQMPPGFTTGRLAYPLYNTRTGLYDVYALFIDGRLMRMAEGADQPCWLGGSGSLAYRDLLSPGISLLVQEATPRQLVSGAGVAWPTFSPDGGRMAYAVQDVAGAWRIYIAPTDGSVEPKVHAAGKGPVWGSTGWLAWTGCEASGACGIFVDNPDDDQPPTRRTASVNDIGLNWAPNGGLLAYMSNVTGNWEVYLLSIEGGVVVLTDDPASDGLPTWAPDGSSIAFASNRDGSWGLYLMGPNGEDPHKILMLGPNLPNWTSQRLSWAP
ncbi:MAG: tetratricopeptide repeat protein [Chloroflexi bacterium]|nr:tetratricopeptide repeat protein [Chloroflexota bacterium]